MVAIKDNERNKAQWKLRIILEVYHIKRRQSESSQLESWKIVPETSDTTLVPMSYFVSYKISYKPNYKRKLVIIYAKISHHSFIPKNCKKFTYFFTHLR